MHDEHETPVWPEDRRKRTVADWGIIIAAALATIFVEAALIHRHGGVAVGINEFGEFGFAAMLAVGFYVGIWLFSFAMAFVWGVSMAIQDRREA